MGIRVTHGDVKTLAQFAVQAGKGEQAVRQAGQDAATQRQQMQIDANAQAQSMRVQADIDMAIMDAQNRRQAMEFQSFMGAESARRNMAWEQDKVEQMRQHDLDMAMTRQELESNLMLQKKMQEQSEMDSKVKSLEDAGPEGTGQISRAVMEKEILRIKINVSGRQSEYFQEPDTSQAAVFNKILADRQKVAEAPQAQPVNTSGLTGEIKRNADGVRIQFNSETRKWQRI
jgi:hypothetical protein